MIPANTTLHAMQDITGASMKTTLGPQHVTNYQHEVQNGDLEQGNEDDSFRQRSVTSITLTMTETELAGNQQVQWIPDSSWTVYHYNGNSTVADEDAEVEFFTN